MKRELRPSPIFVRQEMRTRLAAPGREQFSIPPWGFVEGLEIDFPEPVPHMDSSALLVVELAVTLNGQPVGVSRVRSLHRNVEWPRE